MRRATDARIVAAHKSLAGQGDRWIRVAVDLLEEQPQIRFDTGLVLRRRRNDLRKYNLPGLVDLVAMKNQPPWSFGRTHPNSSLWLVGNSRGKPTEASDLQVLDNAQGFFEGMDNLDRPGQDTLEGIASAGIEPQLVSQTLGLRSESLLVVVQPCHRPDEVLSVCTVGTKELRLQSRRMGYLKLLKMRLVEFQPDGLARTDRDTPRFDGVTICLNKRYVMVRGREIGKREVCQPPRRVDGLLKGLLELGDQVGQSAGLRESVKATDSDVDRVDRPTAEDFEDPIAELLEFQASLDLVREYLGQFDPAMAIEEIGGMEQVDVQHMAFDPFGAVDQTPQRSDGFRDSNAQDRLEGLNGRDLLSDRADATDARSDIGDILDRSASQEGFEEPWGLVDIQFDLLDPRAAQADAQGTFSLDASQDRDTDGTRFAHR